MNVIMFPSYCAKSLLLLSFILHLLSAFPTFGASVAAYGLEKNRVYTQLSGAELLIPSESLSFNPFLIERGTDTNNPSSILLTMPTGNTIQFSNYWAENLFGNYAAPQFFPTSETLNEYAPAGDYIFSFTPVASREQLIEIPFLEGRFPNSTAVISNSEEALSINPSADFVLRWSPFTDATSDDLVGVYLGRFRTAVYHDEPSFVTLNGNATSVNVPAGTLEPGSGGTGVLVFWRNLLVDRDTIPGAIGYSSYAHYTFFTYQVQSPNAVRIEHHSESGLKVVINGVPGEELTLDESGDMVDWHPRETISLVTEEQVIQLPNPPSPAYYRVRSMMVQSVAIEQSRSNSPSRSSPLGRYLFGSSPK